MIYILTFVFLFHLVHDYKSTIDLVKIKSAE